MWATLADLTAVQANSPTVKLSRIEGNQKVGVGAQRLCELLPKGIVVERVTHWEPGQSIGLEITKSDWPIVFMNWVTSVSPEGTGTLVTQTMNYRVKFGPVGALLDAVIMRRKLDASITGVFESLKKYVEGMP